MSIPSRSRWGQVLATFAVVVSATFVGLGQTVSPASADGAVTPASCTLSSSGDGYFEIGTVADLRQFESGVCGWDQKYRQTADIASVGAWTGVGTVAVPFTGVYDGGGHALTGLSIVVSNANGEREFTTGFIARAAGATVSSLTMEATVEGPEGVGAVIAYSAHSTTISDVHVSGTVSSNFYGVTGCVGGLVGQYYGSRIIRSSFAGTVGDDDEWWAGGLVGCLDDESSVEQSTFSGTVIGGGEIGGLVGWMFRSEIVDSSAIANVDLKIDIAGGLVGTLVEDSQQDGDRNAITSSYSRSTFTAGGSTKGGLVGKLSNALLTSTFFQYDLAGAELDTFGRTEGLANEEIPVIPGIFADQMKNFARYADAGWAIADGWEDRTATPPTGNVWGICEGATAPFLLWEEASDPCVPDPACTLVPAPDGYFQIGDLDDLRQFASGVCGTMSNYRQVADIDASPTSTAPWIGAGSYANPFRGTYDGDGYSITGLVTDVPFQEGDPYPGDQLSAFIRVARRATVKDLSIEATIDATYGSGVVIGLGFNTVISDVHATGTVQSVVGFNSGAGCNGGLAGELYGSSGKVLRSSFAGDVIDTGYWIGGLVGCFSEGVIEQSKFSGSVTGDDQVGSLTGWQTAVTITDSYGVGSIVGRNIVGGLGGYVDGNTTPSSPTTSMTTSYASVSIAELPVAAGSQQTAIPTNAGGLIGHAINTTADASFWEAGLAGIDGLPAFGLDESSATMPTGPTSAADMTSFSHFDTAGWAIVDGWEDQAAAAISGNVWGICDGVGKPFLLWEHTTSPCAPPTPIDTTPPTVTITSPADGATVSQGASLVADFVCEDEVGGSGIDTCVGDLADGASIDTSTLGAKTFTVVAKDVDGNETTVTHTYTVVAQADPRLTIRRGNSPAGSTASASVRPRSDVTYRLTVTNGASFPDRVVLRGDGSTRTCDVSYETRRGRDVTNSVVAGSFTTPVLAPGESFVVELEVEATRRARSGSTCATLVVATSQTDSQKSAGVSALTTVR